MSSNIVSIPDNQNIIAVNSTALSKNVFLPSAANYPGRLLFIKDLYGTSGNNNIYVSTSSSIDFIDKGSTTILNLNVNYQSITLTSDGINTWFLINTYFNSLSTLSQNAILPLGFSVICTVIENTLSATWTNSLYSSSYSVSYYFNTTNTNITGTLIQTISGITTLYNSINIISNISYYYYATVTAINTAGQTLITSLTTQPIIFPVAPTIISLFKSPPYIYAFWVAQAYTISYNIKIYKTLSETTINGILIESTSNIRTTYYQGSYIVENGYYYYASITAVNTSGESSNTISSFIFGDFPAQAPSSLIMSYNNGIIICSWTPGFNATSYTVYFYYTTLTTPSGGILVETNNTSATNQNLIANPLGGYNYYAEIVSLNDYSITPSSRKISDNIIVVSVPPSTVGNLSVSLSGYYALATWTISANTITYTVEYYYNTTATTSGGTLIETNSLLENTTTSKTSTTPLPNGYYIYVIVKSVNLSASSSITGLSTTSLTQYAPTNPSNVNISYSTTNNAVIFWIVSSLYATSYNVVLYNNGGTNSTTGGTSVETFNVSGNSVTSTVTLINTNYYYATVTAYSSVSNLSSSTITSPSAYQYSGFVLQSGAITFNSISGLTGGSITITSTAQFATGYRIYISTTTTPTGFSFTTTTTGSAVSFSGATLQNSTTYYAVLVPFNSKGNSASYSYSLGISTLILPTGGNVTTNTFTTSGGSVSVAPSNLATSYSFYISGTTDTGGAVFSTTIYAARFNYTGVDQSYVIPSGFTSMNLILFGAGGTPVPQYGNGGTGGPGGLVSGSLNTTPGETLTVIVGLSGQGYGGGGGNNQGNLPAYGGGRAAIRRGATEIVTAGGGGGAGYTSQGGAGGGLTGGNGSLGAGYGEPWGIGGTQTAGGGRSDNANTSKGGQFFGGNPEISFGTSGNYMGGGGSGWYGGGGGGSGASGGGGSSYVANLTGTVVNTQGGGAPENTNAQIFIYNGSSISYTFSSGRFTFTFSTALSTGNTYYAILIPMNSNGNGIQFVSTGRIV